MNVHVLKPGQRLRFDSVARPVLDEPSQENVTAWQRGQVVFEDTPLAEAAQEFNRYHSDRPRFAGAGFHRVGGTFRVGDTVSFARAVAESHDLHVIDRGEEVLLTSTRLGDACPRTTSRRSSTPRPARQRWAPD